MPRNERARGGVANEGAERPRERTRTERASGGATERVSRKKRGGGARKEGANCPRLEGTPDNRCPEARTSVGGCDRREQARGRRGGGPPTEEHGAGTPCDRPRQSGGAHQGARHKRKYICASGSAPVGLTKRRLSSAGTRDTDQMTREIIKTRSTATNQGNRRI